jgi:hypothetical protein
MNKVIVNFLKSIQGEGRGDVERSINFLLELQKNRTVPPPPLAEVITIIRNEKPILYSILKQRLQSNAGLRILFELELNYLEVKRNLGL